MEKDKLHNMKSTGYKTPERYFESFESTFLDRINKEELLKGTETAGYTIPEDYFNSVDDNVFKKLNKNERPVISLLSKKTFYYVAGIAASIVLLFSIFVNSGINEELSVDIVETYLEERNLDSYELAQLLSDVNLLEEDFTIIDTPFEEDKLESYLLDNADIQTILEY